MNFFFLFFSLHLYKTTKKGHAEFSTGRQQDASEFLTHVMSIFEEKANRVYCDPKEDLSRMFRFDTVTRTDGGASIGVK